jgi:BNR repeat-like domain
MSSRITFHLPQVRIRSARRMGWVGLLAAAALTAAFAAAAPAQAAQAQAGQAGVRQISSDPYTPANAPRGEHATEVEPDTFAYASTVVSAYQVGRVFNGGATDIGFSRSGNGGVSWTHGFLPGTSQQAMRPGPFFSTSDASVAYDARHGTWIISWLGAHFSGGGVVDVMVSRSTDGGHTWGTPITVAATGTFYDKNWTSCDNTATSRFYGNCYTEFDNASSRDLELMSTSSDAGLTWGAPTPTADNVHGLGGQPVAQPNGRVVVPFESTRGEIRSFSSDDGGATWNASVLISPINSHRVAGVRTSSLPSAEINGDGTAYVAWQDSRFESGSANDIVLSTSVDGATWSPVTRIPIDAVGSNVDHFIPGLAVNRDSYGAGTQLALTYYFDTSPSCTGSSCEIQAGFVSSTNNGAGWSTPTSLSSPMQIGWLAPTTQGAMVGDYISTSFLAGQQRVVGVFAIGFPPGPDGLFNEPMFAALEKVRSGTQPMTTAASSNVGAAGRAISGTAR